MRRGDGRDDPAHPAGLRAAREALERRGPASSTDGCGDPTGPTKGPLQERAQGPGPGPVGGLRVGPRGAIPRGRRGARTGPRGQGF